MTNPTPFEQYLRTGIVSDDRFDGVYVPADVDDRIDAAWQAAEREPRDDETRELYANPAASQSMLDDAHFDVVAWLVNDVAATFASTGLDRFLGGKSRVLRDPYTHKPYVHFYVTRAASGTPTRRAETTGSVGEADGGPVPKADAQ